MRVSSFRIAAATPETPNHVYVQCEPLKHGSAQQLEARCTHTHAHIQKKKEEMENGEEGGPCLDGIMSCAFAFTARQQDCVTRGKKKEVGCKLSRRKRLTLISAPFALLALSLFLCAKNVTLTSCGLKAGNAVEK